MELTGLSTLQLQMMVALRVHLSAWGRRLEKKLMISSNGMVDAHLPVGLLAAFCAVEAAVTVPTIQVDCPTGADVAAYDSLPAKSCDASSGPVKPQHEEPEDLWVEVRAKSGMRQQQHQQWKQGKAHVLEDVNPWSALMDDGDEMGGS
eukprot:2689619-Prorocentrum_lima.AAC.1